MTRVNINVGPDCGNAPKKLFLKDFTVALAKGDVDFLTDCIGDHMVWEVVGESQVTGKEDYVKAIKRHKLWKVKGMSIDTIITHGTEASVSGQITAKDNSKFGFCNIYKFRSAGAAIVNSVRTFLVRLP